MDATFNEDLTNVHDDFVHEVKKKQILIDFPQIFHSIFMKFCLKNNF